MPLIAAPSPTAPTASFPQGLKTVVLEGGSGIFRIHHRDNGAIWFGPKLGLPPAYRFDAQGGQYRVMYAAEALDGAFVETILHGRTTAQILSRAYVDQRAWTIVTVRRPLRMLKLYDDGLFWHRTDAGISAAQDYTASRYLALAAYEEGPELDGLAYRARHDNGELCFALFDRVRQDELAAGPAHAFRDHLDALERLRAKYGAVFDPSPPVPPPGPA